MVMRKYYLFTAILMIIALVSCNEEQWLDEVPLDFYAPENSFIEPEHFEAAVTRIYNRWTSFHYHNTPCMPFIGSMADNMYSIGTRISLHNNEMVPETGTVSSWWRNQYGIVSLANTVIDRIDLERVNFPDETLRNIRKAEAKFFRANAYKELVITFGGVPLILQEVQAARRDFVRAPREEVLNQVVQDLQFAVDNLPHVSEREADGRLTTAAASHSLAEVYIMLEQWDNAINEASKVINDPDYALMTERFGTRSDEPGDVFWDLFRRDNQNRNGRGGFNSEAIWVAQFEYNVPGSHAPNVWWIVPRMFGPRYYALEGKEDGLPLFRGHSSQNGGRTNSFTGTTPYVDYDIWEEDWNDMRNSGYNIWRDMVADNPASMYYGDSIVKNDVIREESIGEWRQNWRPFWIKYVPHGNFPDAVIDNSLFPGATTSRARGSYTDRYIYRLAETYLLRAEAFIGKGDLQSAANDINVVRARANATPVTPDRVDIDYLLDERARELNIEEYRLLTLLRMGKLVERVQKYHVYYNGYYQSNTVNPRQALWPIPQSEIERNAGNVLEQNPGYVGGD